MIKNARNAIWLTEGDDDFVAEWSVMWSSERVTSDDVMYVNVALVKRLTESWVYASECGGDLHCYFCGEFQVRTDDFRHEDDCPYIEATCLLDRDGAS